MKEQVILLYIKKKVNSKIFNRVKIEPRHSKLQKWIHSLCNTWCYKCNNKYKWCMDNNFSEIQWDKNQVFLLIHSTPCQINRILSHNLWWEQIMVSLQIILIQNSQMLDQWDQYNLPTHTHNSKENLMLKAKINLEQRLDKTWIQIIIKIILELSKIKTKNKFLLKNNLSTMIKI